MQVWSARRTKIRSYQFREMKDRARLEARRNPYSRKDKNTEKKTARRKPGREPRIVQSHMGQTELAHFEMG